MPLKRNRITGRFALSAWTLHDTLMRQVDDVVPVEHIDGWMQRLAFDGAWVFERMMNRLVGAIR